MPSTAFCVFCPPDTPTELTPGSKEHVFLSALGGRLQTTNATCSVCNNHFATTAGGKIDDALADAFSIVRCALLIWTGRDDPPPTLRRAGTFPEGLEFDLGPGFVPLPRRAQVPDFSMLPRDAVQSMTARDTADAQRIIEIAAKRGFAPKVVGAQRVISMAPQVPLRLTFDGPKVWRAVAKTAIAGGCVMYGNDAMRTRLDPLLCRAVRDGAPEISAYCGWDYVNPWPTKTELVAHEKTPTASTSGFEHMLFIADIGLDWVAFVELFGAFRLSVRLGTASGLPPRGLAMNPRAFRPARFNVQIVPPLIYRRRYPISSQEEEQIHAATAQGLQNVLSKWEKESRCEYSKELSSNLMKRIESAGPNEDQLRKAVRDWLEQIAAIKGGASWREDLDMTFIDDALNKRT